MPEPVVGVKSDDCKYNNSFLPSTDGTCSVVFYEAEKEKADAAIASDRRAQVGTGDRSERIRTYNYPQGRVTDHRIGLTLYKIDSILNGDIDEIIDALTTHYRAEALKAQENS